MKGYIAHCAFMLLRWCYSVAVLPGAQSRARPSKVTRGSVSCKTPKSPASLRLGLQAWKRGALYIEYEGCSANSAAPVSLSSSVNV